jgi:hypothetical protein
MIWRATIFSAVLLLVLSSAAGAKKLYGELDQWGAVCNTAGIKLNGAQVEKVMLGTPAYFSGLRDKDTLLDCNVGDQILKITFERGGKRYAVTVPLDPAAIQPGISVDKINLRSKISESEALKTLSEFDIVVFMDCSGSMADPIRAESMRKWDWASKNVKEFNAKFNAAAQRKITLVTFSDHFSVMPNVSMADLDAVFGKRQPSGGTDLATPLEAVLDEKLRNIEKRPCVIVILHDGISDNEDKVRQILQRTASKVVRPGKIYVTFIQIGDDSAGSETLREFEDANYGGKNIVSAELFDQMKGDGLAKAIARSLNIPQKVSPITAITPATVTPPPAKAMPAKTTPKKR